MVETARLNTHMTKALTFQSRKPVRAMLAATLAPVFLVTGCVSGANDYNRSSIGVQSELAYGRLVGLEPVRVQGSRTGIGAASGAALGGVLGSQVGNRNRGYGRRGGRGRHHGGGNVAGAIGFAILGGLVGAAIEEGASGGTGWRYTIELEDGRTVSVVQADRDPVARVGEPVRVEYGRDVRVLRG